MLAVLLQVPALYDPFMNALLHTEPWPLGHASAAGVHGQFGAEVAEKSRMIIVRRALWSRHES